MVHPSSSLLLRCFVKSLELKAKSEVAKLQSDSTELVKDAVRSISPYMWYTALPQLTSR